VIVIASPGRGLLLLVVVLAIIGLGGRPAPAWIETAREYSLTKVGADPLGGGDATISPDGRQFVISSRRSGNWELWLYDLASAKWSQLTTDPGEDFEARWSPDGRRLAFTSTRAGQKDIWILAIATGELTRLTWSAEEDEYPAWSPDGRSIVYTSGPWLQRDIFLIDAAGGTPRKVTTRSGRAGACSFDPGGDALICHRYDLGSGDLIRMWLDDGSIAPLTIGTPWDYKPFPTTDGAWIAFSRAQEGPSQIFVLPGGGGRARQLTHGPDDDRWPSWSADGRKVFFHRLADRGVGVSLFDRQTGTVRQLISAEQQPLQASLDPQARRIAFCHVVEGRKTLAVADVMTGVSHPLRVDGGDACYPSWSPDGEWIAFGIHSGGRWEIARIRPDGSGMQLLTIGDPTLHGMDGPLDWSPDSTRIVFQSDTDPFEASIYTVDVRSRRIDRLTTGHWFDEAPAFRPDGKAIAFMSTRGGRWTWGLFELDLTTGALQAFAGPDWNERNYPRFASDGSIAWSSIDERGEHLTERRRGQQAREVAAAGTRVRWPSYSRDGRFVVFTQVEHTVEYWIAQNPFGRGSPLASAPTSAQNADVRMAPAICLGPHETISPVGLHRR
jgi:TolB protein